MKAFFINSSYRQTGNTALALAIVAESLQQKGVIVESINIAHMNIQTCHGCRLCFDKGEEACPHKDDLLGIYARVQEADLLVIGSPIYVEDINGVLKNWIDRMAFICHRPSLFGKKAFLICTSGSGASGHGFKTVQRAFQSWGIQTIGKAQFIAGAEIEKEAFLQKYGQKIEKIVATILHSMDVHRKPSLISIVTFQIQKMCYLNVGSPQTSASAGAEESSQISKSAPDSEADLLAASIRETYDYTFWKRAGWLEKDRVYYTEESIGALKTGFATLLGKFVMKFVLK